MLDIRERIIREEEKFFNEHLLTPNLIIVRPEIKSELIEFIGENIYEDDLEYYEGLLVCLTFKQDFPEFQLGYATGQDNSRTNNKRGSGRF